MQSMWTHNIMIKGSVREATGLCRVGTEKQTPQDQLWKEARGRDTLVFRSSCSANPSSQKKILALPWIEGPHNASPTGCSLRAISSSEKDNRRK